MGRQPLRCADGHCVSGPPGVGTTHLALSLAAAVQNPRRVYWGTFADLITALEEVQQRGRLAQRMKTLVFPSVLVVDEIGYLSVSRTGAMPFVQLMSRHHEHASTAPTSNKSSSVQFLPVLTGWLHSLAAAEGPVAQRDPCGIRLRAPSPTAARAAPNTGDVGAWLGDALRVEVGSSRRRRRSGYG